MQELLWGRTNRLRLDFIDEAISNADEAIIEQLANDQLVKLLAVLQAHFGSVHRGEEENNFSASCKEKRGGCEEERHQQITEATQKLDLPCRAQIPALLPALPLVSDSFAWDQVPQLLYVQTLLFPLVEIC